MLPILRPASILASDTSRLDSNSWGITIAELTEPDSSTIPGVLGEHELLLMSLPKTSPR